MLLTLDDFKRYCGQFPPIDIFDLEIEEIKKNLSVYPQEKMQYIQYYINKNNWIKLYLYHDELVVEEIKELESSIEKQKAKKWETPEVKEFLDVIKSPLNKDQIAKLKSIKNCEIFGPNLSDLIMRKIDVEIQKANGIFNYLKLRIQDHYETFLIKLHNDGIDLSAINTYDEIFKDNHEAYILSFLASIGRVIEEIESIEDSDINIPLVSKDEQLFVNFKSIKNHQKLYNGLVAMDRAKNITVTNWPMVLAGKNKIIWNLQDVDLLGFMQTLQNHRFIHDYRKRGASHADRICKIFKPTEPRKDNDGGYDSVSLASQYSRGQKDGRFYHDSILYFEKILKIPTT